MRTKCERMRAVPGPASEWAEGGEREKATGGTDTAALATAGQFHLCPCKADSRRHLPPSVMGLGRGVVEVTSQQTLWGLWNPVSILESCAQAGRTNTINPETLLQSSSSSFRPEMLT